MTKTLNMKKIVGSSINGVIMGVQEVVDGLSETMIKEIDKQLTKLRTLANEFNLPNAKY